MALKVLPPAFTDDPDRLARFEREAKVLASLNHPGIAGIYGLEEQHGTKALVLELVEGPTLADRIAQGPIPVDEALPIAKQIAEALEAAHEQGIIHRDLKPANVKLRPDGTVKVLDFGLAKALNPVPEGDPSQPPTLTAAATQMGVLIGTAAYMSPEQARGKLVDRRADIWAFGCVLYEMLTGKRAYEGADVSVTLANVINAEPAWTELPGGIPPSLVTFLKRCLHKALTQRVQAIGDMRLALDGAFETGAPQVVGTVAVAQPAWLRPVPVALAASLLVGLAAWSVRPASQPAERVARFALSSETAPLTVTGLGRDLAISPDGARVVYTSGFDGRLYVREIDRLEGAALPGTAGATHPSFSPDGDWIAFGLPNAVGKVSLSGGSPVNLAQAIGVRGVSWVDDDTIVFASRIDGLSLVPAAGGEVIPLLPDDRSAERPRLWPEVLPGGRAVLYSDPSGGGPGGTFLLNLETLEERLLVSGQAGRYSPSGHLVYAEEDGTLLAVPFDLDRLEVTGDPSVVLEGVTTKANGAASFDLAADGTLVYADGPGLSSREVVWVNRDGQATPMPGLPRGAWRDVRVSTDGARVAVATQEDVWIYDVSRATLSRLTTNPASDRSPQWFPDGTRIVFTSDRGGRFELFWRSADGTGDDELFLSREDTLIDLRANDWSLDGSQLVFEEVPPQINCRFGVVSATDGSEVVPPPREEFCNDHATLSPDGRWFAYDSDRSGRFEIYVERYPGGGGRQQVSPAGGQLPIWSADGDELFFSGLGTPQIFAVSVQSGNALVVGRPEVLFDQVFDQVNTGRRPYDVSPDGRFAMIIRGDAENMAAGHVVLVQNFFAELERLVPAR